MNQLPDSLLKYWPNAKKWLSNRYIFAGLLFLVFVIFFDKSRLISQHRLQQDIDHLSKEKEKYERMISQLEQENQDILSNKEKYAREKYFDKSDNEDVYVIED